MVFWVCKRLLSSASSIEKTHAQNDPKVDKDDSKGQGNKEEIVLGWRGVVVSGLRVWVCGEIRGRDLG